MAERTPFIDPDAPIGPDHPIGLNMTLADLRELAQFGRNLAKRNLGNDPAALIAEIDATLRGGGVCEPDLDLARGVVVRAMAAERGIEL